MEYYITTVANSYHLDAVLEEIAGGGVALLLIQRLAEDDYLLKEEDPPLLHPGEKSTVLVAHHECVLKKETALGYNLPLDRKERSRPIHMNTPGTYYCFFPDTKV